MNTPQPSLDTDPASASQQPWIIVTQVKSERIVYFTSDPDYQPALEDWCYASQFIGPLPDGMTLRNCWGWRFNGGVFRDARPAPAASTEERLIDSNRRALLRLLNDKINAVREPLAPSAREGAELRRQKLEQARRFVRAEREDLGTVDGQGRGGYPLLEAVAVARHISLHEAAALVEAKALRHSEVLLETERFREQFTQAITGAQTQAQLLELREWLLDKVYPALSERFAYRNDHTTPPDLDAPLPEIQRVHEQARLKAQLREAINRQRVGLRSDYVRNDEVTRHKLRLAQQLLAADGWQAPDIDYGLLNVYAVARHMTSVEAAHVLVASGAAAAQLLADTELSKDEMLARIDGLQCLRHVHQIDSALDALQPVAAI